MRSKEKYGSFEMKNIDIFQYINFMKNGVLGNFNLSIIYLSFMRLA